MLAKLDKEAILDSPPRKRSRQQSPPWDIENENGPLGSDDEDI